MIKTVLFNTMCFAMLFLTGLSPTMGQKKEVDLQDKRITIWMDKKPLGVVFRYLFETYDVPIGFEQSILDRNHSDYSFQTNLPSVGTMKMESSDGEVELDIEAEVEFLARNHLITVNIENGRLSDVLNQIVSQMTNYKWEVNDAVVNIFPIRGRDKRFADLLETRIEKFSLPDSKTVNDITFGILALREFRAWQHKNKLHFNPARTGASILLDAQYGRKLDSGMNFSDLSFRDLLNKITKAKKGGWILRWGSISAKGEEYIYLDI